MEVRSELKCSSRNPHYSITYRGSRIRNMFVYIGQREQTSNQFGNQSIIFLHFRIESENSM